MIVTSTCGDEVSGLRRSLKNIILTKGAVDGGFKIFTIVNDIDVVVSEFFVGKIFEIVIDVSEVDITLALLIPYLFN